MPRMFLLYSYYGLTPDGGLNGKATPSYSVIPAKAGIQRISVTCPLFLARASLDPRFRGGDEWRVR
jgi:hypothetical protein